VECQLDELTLLLRRTIPAEREKEAKAALDRLPRELYVVYEQILERIPEKEKEKAVTMLQWLTYSERPLRLEELYEVIAPDAKDAEFAPTKRESVQTYIKEFFTSLITISEDSGDGKNSLVRFAHYTVTEYLLSKETQQGKYSEFYMEEVASQVSIADRCLSCLQFCDQYGSNHASTEADCQYCPRKRPLLEYAANNWYRHALKIQGDATTIDASDKPTVTQAEEVIRSTTLFDRAYAIILFYLLNMIQLISVLLKRTGFTDFGRKERLDTSEDISVPEDTPKSLSEWAESTKSMINQTSEIETTLYGNTLKAAAYEGYEKLVRLLLAHGAPVDSRDVLGAAISDSYEEIIDILCEKMTGHFSNDTWWPSKSGLRADVKTLPHKSEEEIVRLLVEKGAPVDAVGMSGGTALHWAATRGHEALVWLLVEKGAVVNATDGDGGTALHWAATRGHEAVVRLLVGEGAPVDARDWDGGTTLHWAAIGGDVVVVRLLVEEGAPVDATDGRGRTPLHEAAARGDEAVVRLLVEEGAAVDATDGRGRAALHWAAIRGHEVVVRLLVEKGAVVDVTDGRGLTALHEAAARGHEAVVRPLVEKGAPVDATDGGGGTALHWAATRGHDAVVRLLVEKGAAVDVTDGDGGTALHWAATCGHEVVVRLLVEEGAPVDATDWGGRTALHWAAAGGDEAVVRLLVEKGAAVDATDGCGRTALHWAATRRREVVVRLLVEEGAAVDARDERGGTALHWAAAGGHEAVVRLLVEKGAAVDATDGDEAAAGGYWAVVKLLEAHDVGS
jgi:ankyrin repeat protein